MSLGSYPRNTVAAEISKYMGNAVKLAEIWGGIIYNVKAAPYLAKGDGTDDSAAVSACIAAANGAPVFFPSGTYNVSAMSPVGGRVNLLGYGSAIVQGFSYAENNATLQNHSSPVSPTDTVFIADGITFQAIGSAPGLKIHNQSQGSIIRSFSIKKCDFYGQTGLQTQNCISGVLEGCNFYHNQRGWKSESCTNITATDCQWFSPAGYGIDIETSSDDTAGRLGGENIKLVNCYCIDGVTFIRAIKHNYLWLDSCMIDYMNNGLYLQGSRFAKLHQTYIGYAQGSLASMPNYIAPSAYGCIYGFGDQSSSHTTGITCDDCDFENYDGSSDLVKLDGSATTFGGIEDTTFTNCRFGNVTTTNTAAYLLNIIQASDAVVSGNRFYSPNNNNLVAPWVFTNCSRLQYSNNDFANCFKSGGATVSPSSGQIGNQVMEATTVTLTGNGTANTDTPQYVVINKYASSPKVIATAQPGGTFAGINKINVTCTSKDAANVYVQGSHIDGTAITTGQTIIVDVFVIGTLA